MCVLVAIALALCRQRTSFTLMMVLRFIRPSYAVLAAAGLPLVPYSRTVVAVVMVLSGDFAAAPFECMDTVSQWPFAFAATLAGMVECCILNGLTVVNVT